MLRFLNFSKLSKVPRKLLLYDLLLLFVLLEQTHKYNILLNKCFMEDSMVESLFGKIIEILSTFFNDTKNCNRFEFVKMF